MKRNLVIFAALVFGIFSISCGGGSNSSVNNANTEKTANSTASTPGKTAIPESDEFITGVWGLKGERMPDDKELAEQKRDFANAIHIKLRKNDSNKDFNWEERFKEPTALKFEEGEQILVITFASKTGGKIEPGDYVATDAEDWVKTAPKDKPLAVITLVNSQGAKRLKGNVKVTNTDKMIMYMFNEKPDAKGLDSMSYGAPFKN